MSNGGDEEMGKCGVAGSLHREEDVAVVVEGKEIEDAPVSALNVGAVGGNESGSEEGGEPSSSDEGASFSDYDYEGQWVWEGYRKVIGSECSFWFNVYYYLGMRKERDEKHIRTISVVERKEQLRSEEEKTASVCYEVTHIKQAASSTTTTTQAASQSKDMVLGLPRLATRIDLPVIRVEQDKIIKIGTPVRVNYESRWEPGIFLGYDWWVWSSRGHGRALRAIGLSTRTVKVRGGFVSIRRKRSKAGRARYERGIRVVFDLKNIKPCVAGNVLGVLLVLAAAAHDAFTRDERGGCILPGAKPSKGYQRRRSRVGRVWVDAIIAVYDEGAASLVGLRVSFVIDDAVRLAYTPTAVSFLRACKKFNALKATASSIPTDHRTSIPCVYYTSAIRFFFLPVLRELTLYDDDHAKTSDNGAFEA
ncbi:hypothetical protein FPV67DRAFT_1454797 [Lyophyllum atratum]|nr:hypothetical protein FPV67DRAFT_1454797 [Lyophyllum atratum]